jgi:hypothetical protein
MECSSVKMPFDMSTETVYTYDIESFKWNAKNNCFYPKDSVLVIEKNGEPTTPTIYHAFPSSRNNFFIKNTKTGQVRKFCLIEIIPHSYVDFDSILIFESMYGNETIRCEVKEWNVSKTL